MTKIAEMRYWMAEAYRMATFSPDPRTQNGAVIVNPQQEVAEGFNHFYPGIEPELEDRETRLQRIVHAEHDAILDAAHRGYRMQGATMFCPWAACRQCTIAILGARIKQLVIHKPRFDLSVNGQWQKEISEAFSWLKYGGVRIEWLDDSITEYDEKSIRVSGQLWSPKTCEFVAK